MLLGTVKMIKGRELLLDVGGHKLAVGDHVTICRRKKSKNYWPAKPAKIRDIKPSTLPEDRPGVKPWE